MDQGRQERGEVDAALLPRLRGQPSPAATVRLGVQPGQLLSQARPPPKCQALVNDDLEGEADQDWRKGRDPRPVCHVSDGRGGYFTTVVQEHPSPHFATRSSLTPADMTIALPAKREIVQDPMARCAQIGENSTDGHPRWPQLGHERHQRAATTAKLALTSSASRSTIAKISLGRSQAHPYGKCRLVA